MKTYMKIMLMVLLIGVCLCGCQKKQVNTSEDIKEQETVDKETSYQEKDKKENSPKEDAAKKEPVQQTEDNTHQDDQQSPVKIQVYLSNNDATAFVSEEMEIASLSPEMILEALLSKGVIIGDVQIQKFETVDREGRPTIEIDFNEAFATHLRSMGTTGEYYALGAVCNTFLSAYECEQIKITVSGEVLQTGHAEYTGYLGMFE